MRNLNQFVTIAAVAILTAGLAKADLVLMDFENFSDFSSVAGAYAAQGVTFSSGFVVNAGNPCFGSLFEAEFPPFSGCGVFLNDAFLGDTTTLTFASPVTSFQGYITYGGPLTIEFFNASNLSLMSLSSTFPSNLGLSGTGLPNELFSAPVLANATRIVITAPSVDFTMDDVTVETLGSSVVPEPGTITMMFGSIAGLAVAGAWRRRARYRP
jgi:hypothetical protein